MAYFIQPKYYRTFQCTGDKCPYTCCAKWRISWTAEEVERVKSAQSSPELREIINNGFIFCEESNNYIINLSPKPDHSCPFLDQNGLCRIQKELGAEYLSTTCMVYPRRERMCNNIIQISCSSSCYEVMKMLASDPEAMELFSAPIKIDAYTEDISVIDQKTIADNPSIQYRNEIFNLFYDIISDKNRTLETSIVLGALAAQKLTEYEMCGQKDRIPDVIKSLRPQLKCRSIPAFENIKPNYEYSLGLVSRITELMYNNNVIRDLYDGDQLSVKKYLHGRNIFNEFTQNKPFFLRNLSLNHMLECYFPFVSKDRSIFDNYCYYTSMIAVSVLLCSSFAEKYKAFNDNLLVILSHFIRNMYYSSHSVYLVFDFLKEKEINTPAKLALMIK